MSQINTVSCSSLTTQTALELANKALEIAQQKGYNICVTITDSKGISLVVLRDNLANFITPDSSFKKAFTASAMGMSTQVLSEKWKDSPHLLKLSEAHESILVYGGGYPICLKNEKLGGIGIAGCPGGHLDDSIAEEALKTSGFEIEN